MTVLTIAAAVVVFALAAMWLTVGVLGLTGRLPGSRWFGVRSAETVYSEDAFRIANRVAGPGLIGAGVILALGGLLTLGVDGWWSWIFALVALVVALFVVGLVSGIGIRAAEAATAAESSDAGCGCCGDDHGAASSTDVAATDSPADDCGESSCGACTLRGRCSDEKSVK